jgi:hypothetical protein
VVVLPDVLHLTRSGGIPDDMLDYPARLFPYVQIWGRVALVPHLTP